MTKGKGLGQQERTLGLPPPIRSNVKIIEQWGRGKLWARAQSSRAGGSGAGRKCARLNSAELLGSSARGHSVGVTPALLHSWL